MYQLIIIIFETITDMFTFCICVLLLILALNPLISHRKIPGRMGRGRAGGPGQHVHRGGRLGQGPVITLLLMGAEQPAEAPPLRLSTVELTQRENLCFFNE